MHNQQPNMFPPPSQANWVAWVQERLRNRAEIYRTEPSELTSAAQREQQSTGDYHGREILELLQNADDAGSNFTGECRVALVLTQEGLYVGNTGNPFSQKGVESLLISNNSPKQLDRNAFIGNKGLGFRAILNWTNEPMILSGDLALGFSALYAAHWLDILCHEADNVKDHVNLWRMKLGDDSKVVPTLAIPYLLDNVQLLSDRAQSVLKKARELRDQGYDTVIAMPFNDANGYDEALHQIATQALPELLLFVNHLVELHVITSETDHCWRIERSSDTIRITSDTASSTWRIVTGNGIIPNDLLPSDHKSTPGYTVALAWPEEVLSETPGVLFSFFPTGIRFPFPLIAHATLILKSDRQDIILNDANCYVLARLAELLAEEINRLPIVDPWLRLHILSGYQNAGTSLEQLGFVEVLLEQARTKEILPTLGGQLLTPAEARIIASKTDYLRQVDWLPAGFFADLVRWPNQESLAKTIKELQPCSWPLQEFLDDLPNHNYTLEERAKLIAGCLKYKLLSADNKYRPDLLIDDDNRVIPKNVSVFLPPADGKRFHLPDWLGIALINHKLVAMLRANLEINTLGELRAKLSIYSVEEYRFENLVRQVARSLKQHIREQPNERIDSLNEAIRCYFELFQQSIAAINSQITDITIELPSLTGDYIAAKQLYFHQTYPLSPLGLATSFLYEQADPSCVVAQPISLGLADQNLKLIVEFLSWCGVASQPREFSQVDSSQIDSACEYHQFVIRRLSYPVQFSNIDESVSSPDELLYSTISQLTCIDRLKILLEYADPRAILAWVALDDRMSRWDREGERQARLRQMFKYKHQSREMLKQSIPSHVLWYVAHIPWMPSKIGLIDPKRCFSASTNFSELADLFPKPSIDLNDPFFQKFGLSSRHIQKALHLVGVVDTIDDITWDDVYQLLLDLPQLDPEGRSARQLYRAIVLRPLDNFDLHNPTRDQFLKEGTLLAIHQGVSRYVSISSIFYKDMPGLPIKIYDFVYLLVLEQRHGSNKVEKVFGVKTIGSSNTKITVSSYNLHPKAEEFARKIEQAKAYVGALRLRQQGEVAAIRRLKGFEVRICIEARGNVELPNRLQCEIVLCDQSDQLIDDKHAYLVVEADDPVPSLTNSLIADQVGEVLAVALRVERGGEFARLLSASRQHRDQLLANMLDISLSEVEDLLKRVRKLLDLVPDEEETSQSRKYIDPPQAINPSQNSTSQNSNNVLFQQNDLSPSSMPSMNSATPTILPPVTADETLLKSEITAPKDANYTIEQKQHIPIPPPRRVDFRISRTSSSSNGFNIRHEPADAAKAEELVGEYERLCGRFPLLAAHLKGFQAYGCDWLSFASEESYTRFRETLDESLVQRFIEVKSTITPKGEILLEGNELDAAERYEDRYFIYRVFYQGPDAVQIIVLDNPLEDCPTIFYRINVLRSKRSEVWDMRRV